MKKLFWICMTACICLALMLFLRSNVLVMNFLESITGDGKKEIIMIDPGHPATSLGTENKVRVGTIHNRIFPFGF